MDAPVTGYDRDVHGPSKLFWLRLAVMNYAQARQWRRLGRRSSARIELANARRNIKQAFGAQSS